MRSKELLHKEMTEDGRTIEHWDDGVVIVRGPDGRPQIIGTNVCPKCYAWNEFDAEVAGRKWFGLRTLFRTQLRCSKCDWHEEAVV